MSFYIILPRDPKGINPTTTLFLAVDACGDEHWTQDHRVASRFPLEIATRIVDTFHRDYPGHTSKTIEEINFESSGGDLDVSKRVLQTHTLKTLPNGCIGVSDDRTGFTVGAGFATVDDAVAWYKPFDRRRVSW